MRLYRLYRRVDVNGSSGIGLVAEATVFSSGRCAVSFLPGKVDVSSVSVFDSLEDAQIVHGHGDKAIFVPVSVGEYSGREQEAQVSHVGKRRLAA